MRRFVSVLLVFLFSATTFPQTDNGCGLKFTGKARKLVKMRLANRNYLKFKNGGAISVREFLAALCSNASARFQIQFPRTALGKFSL